MEKQYDLVIIGSGPAGLAAAIYAQRARLNTLVIEKEMMSGGQVLSTYEVDNYPGFPGINGFDLGMKLRQHADQLEAVFCEDEVEGIELVKTEEQQGEEQLQAAELREISDSMMSKSAAEKTGNSAVMKRIIGKKDTYYAKTVIIASGAMHSKLGVPGEEEFGGMGVSYCATCDAPLYRGATVAVIAYQKSEETEADFLADIAQKVSYFPMYKEPVEVSEKITVVKEVPKEITGGMKADTLLTKENSYPVDGVFILRESVSPKNLVPGLQMDGNHVAVNLQMETNVPGCFACGDIAGRPYQYIKSAGQGNIAALSAVSFLDQKRRSIVS